MGALQQLGLLAILATSLVFALPEDVGRRRKAIGIFNVVQFPNDACIGTGSMNGTCYTSEECSSRDGVSSGSCAEGYGVCCVISISCGSTSSENCTYISQTASTSPSVSPAGSGVCSYTICPMSSDINRIRLDLTTFSIAGPIVPANVLGVATGTNTQNTAIGHCMTDTFDVSGAPTICGLNTGKHMIVDSDGTECITATFTYTGATDSRSYVIKVTQYDKSNSLELAGQAGCLQFYTGDTGTLETFNWQGVGTTARGATSTHLANQKYNICIRQNVGMCTICYAGGTGGAANIVGTFGVSNGAESEGATGKSGVDADCPGAADSNDWVVIEGGTAIAGVVTSATANAALVTAAGNILGNNRFCGRHLSNDADGVQIDATICTRRTPFQLGVHFDGFEAGAAAATAAADMANTNEAADGAGADYNTPLGTIGFQLGFFQIGC